MWGAIKTDLFDFINTITEDTTKTLNKVLGEEDENEEEISIQQKLVADLRRSYETYGTPIKESDLKDYEKFKKKFSITSLAEDIANVLDEEPEVSRYYTELVPITISPDEFWARLYYRVNQIYRNGGVNLDEEDDEELVWENEIVDNSTTTTNTITTSVPTSLSMKEDTIKENDQSNNSDVINTTINTTTNTSNASTIALGETMSADIYMKERIIKLEEENQKLKTQEEKLLKRLQELELLLINNNNNNNNIQLHDNINRILPHPVVQISSSSHENENINDTITNLNYVEDINNNESKSNHSSDEGSIVIVDHIYPPSIIPNTTTTTTLSTNIHITPDKVNNPIHHHTINSNNIMITPINTNSDTMMDDHNKLLETLTINTPVITGYYTPSETRIDDDNNTTTNNNNNNTDHIINENEITIMNHSINKNELFIDNKEHLNIHSNDLEEINDLKGLNKTDQYLASLDDDEEEEENGWN